MFFIHTLEGLYRDLSLESLMQRSDVTGIKGYSRARKLIHGEKESDSYTPGGRTLEYAEKSYRESMNLKNEFEPLFHAYQIMSSPVKTILPGINITEAWDRFRHEKVRHMPVVSENMDIEGILSERDLLKRLIVTGEKVTNVTDEKVSDIMIREVITASRITDIRRIAMVMFNMHIGTMPILDDEKKLVGIITKSDILHALITYPPIKLWG